MMMQRALRWLWRQCRLIALIGLTLIGGSMLLAASPPRAFAAKSVRLAQTHAPTNANRVSSPAQDQGKARERARRGRLLFLASFVYEGLLVFGFLALGGTRWLARIAARFGGRWIYALAVIVGIITLASTLLTFPLDYYSGFTFQHEYGLSNQTTWQWLRDYLVSGAVGLVVGIPVATLIYAIFRRAPRTWWLWVTIASVPISIFFMLISPVFIDPLFNKFTPVQDETLRQEILELARRQGIHAQDVYQVNASRQSKEVNAYVNGFGPTMRIVLFDTLITDFTHEEIQFVMAHEMGHYVLKHIYQGIAFAILGTLVGSFMLYRLARWVLARFEGQLGFRALGDPASYPLLMALGMILSVIAMPVSSALSRHLEWEADRHAAYTYPNLDAGISSFHKLAKINIAEENPPRWAVVLFGSHPPLAERIKALEALKAGDPNPWPLPRK